MSDNPVLQQLSLGTMKTQLYFDLAGKTDHPKIHFRESKEVEEIMDDLRTENIAVFEIDGAALSSQEDLFKAFAMVLRKPKGWNGEEEYQATLTLPGVSGRRA